MMQLNNDVVSILKKNNADWVEAIREAEDNNTGIDLSQIIDKNAQRFEEINQAFNRHAERSKKKGFWRS